MSEREDDVFLQYTQRPEGTTSNDFTVKDFESLLNNAHAATVKSYYCGFSKWFDNHHAYDGHQGQQLDTYVKNLDKTNTIYRLWSGAGAENIYVTHGYTDVFSRWLTERGYNAKVVPTQFGDAGEEESKKA